MTRWDDLQRIAAEQARTSAALGALIERGDRLSPDERRALADTPVLIRDGERKPLAETTADDLRDSMAYAAAIAAEMTTEAEGFAAFGGVLIDGDALDGGRIP